MTAYATGLRVSELVRLLPKDILSERGLVFVRQGKGLKDRYTLLSQTLLTALRVYYRHKFIDQNRRSHWLFADQDLTRHYSERSAQRVFEAAKAKAKIVHGKGIHCLRHSFATIPGIRNLGLTFKSMRWSPQARCVMGEQDGPPVGKTSCSQSKLSAWSFAASTSMDSRR